MTGRPPVVAVVDDDPTGTQAVAGVPALIEPDAELIARTLAERPRALFVLTNSRSLPESEAVTVNRAIGAALARASAAAGVAVRLVSRSDSTLRGHFPAESNALAAGWEEGGGGTVRATVLCPAFPEAGRITVGGMQIVRDGAELVPVAATEAAKDPVFGFATSDLVRWVGARAPGVAVQRITLDELRLGGAATVAKRLLEAPERAVLPVDAVCDADLQVLADAAARAEAAGQRLLFRSGPSLVRALAALPPARRLGRADFAALAPLPGIVVAGSYTRRTTRQISEARQAVGDRVVELDVDAVLDGDRDAAVASAARACTASLRSGTTVLCTSRAPLPARPGQLAAARRISSALTDTATRVLSGTPVRYVVAKGGITSHDVARDVLGIRRASVLGTLFPGQVSVLAPDVAAAGAPPLVVFPGNVGEPAGLRQAIETLEPPS